MSQKDIERSSENLQIVYPGISFPPVASGISCAVGPTCDKFTMTISNLAGIGTQIARVYINSTTECSSLCVLDPAQLATSSSFNYGDRFINPSEPNHLVNFWMATGTLTNQTTHQVSVVTARGRVFSFNWPFPTSGPSAATGSLYLGCLAINFDNHLITYTANSPTSRQTPTLPMSGGGWLFPGGQYLILYVRVANICTANVTLLDKSTFYAVQYTGSGGGAADSFYLVAPTVQSYCKYLTSSLCVYTSDTLGNTFPDSQGNVKPYNDSRSSCSASNPCYTIPAAPAKGQQSQSVYVLFAAPNACFQNPSTCNGDQIKANTFHGSAGGTYVVFLAIYWACATGGDLTCSQNYEFGVTLPFITVQTT